MIGHSMGGYITLAYADAYPQRLTGIGLFHSTALADAEEKKESRKKAIAFIQENGPLKFMQASIQSLFTSEHANLPALKQLLDQATSFSGETLIQYYAAMMQRKDLTKVLVNSNIPVLLIAGVDDQAIPFEQSLKESSLAAETHFHVLRYTAHMGMLEEPEKSNYILANYLHFCMGAS
jgi:pimeloyl-ACP methyl ester carboxylesterase